MKKIYCFFLFSFLLVTLFSCYSPKEKVEKDRYPDVPEFPKFKDDAAVLEKLTEIEGFSDYAVLFDKKEDKLLVYVPNIDLKDGKVMKKSHLYMIIQNGKEVKTLNWDCWKENGVDGESMQAVHFFADNGDLFLGNRKFKAPTYKKEKKIGVFEFAELLRKFSSAPSAEEMQELSIKLQEKQSEFENKVITIREVYCGANAKLLSEPRSSIYLCNENTTNPFYVDGGIFEDFQLTSKGERTYEVNKVLVSKFKPLVKGIEEDKHFGGYKVYDQKNFSETEKIVIANEWFSTGNHFSGSSGYSQIYLRYFDLKLKNETAKTKVNEKNMTIPELIDVSGSYYFVTTDEKNNFMTVHYLKK